MTRAGLLAALLAMLLLIGCDRKGTWLSGTYKGKPSTRAADSVTTFQADGTCSFKDKSGNVIEGTYILEGKELRIKVVEMNGKAVEGKQAEPVTWTVSEDGMVLGIGGVEFRKQE